MDDEFEARRKRALAESARAITDRQALVTSQLSLRQLRIVWRGAKPPGDLSVLLEAALARTGDSTCPIVGVVGRCLPGGMHRLEIDTFPSKSWRAQLPMQRSP